MHLAVHVNTVGGYFIYSFGAFFSFSYIIKDLPSGISYEKAKALF
jgi:hypothetical protein